MIKLNKRLTTISAFILKNDKVIDIGCDHNLLAIYMYLKKGIKIVGSDINSEPLNIARNNLLKYDLSNTLELRLGDGISTILDEDTIVISGMGGITITKILDKINDYNIKKLIISPNFSLVEFSSLMSSSLSKTGKLIMSLSLLLDSTLVFLSF